MDTEKGSPVKLCVLFEETFLMLFDELLATQKNATHTGLRLAVYPFTTIMPILVVLVKCKQPLYCKTLFRNLIFFL